MMFVQDYRDNDVLRASFNELAGKIFGLNFEDWYQNGYWTHKYNPYSMIEDGKVIANVSVNLTDYLWKGKRWKFIQLGTVMTDEAYRNKGLIRQLMEEIEKDYAEIVDGVFARQECDLDKIIAAFGKEIKKVRLTFAPIQKEGYEVLSYREEDCTLFIKGKGFEDFNANKVRFPELAHA